MFRCPSPFLASVSNFRHVVRSLRISRYRQLAARGTNAPEGDSSLRGTRTNNNLIAP